MLLVRFEDWDAFIEHLKRRNPSGERYYAAKPNGEDRYNLIVVVQNDHRLIVYEDDMTKEEELDKIHNTLDRLDFVYVDDIEIRW